MNLEYGDLFCDAAKQAVRNSLENREDGMGKVNRGRWVVCARVSSARIVKPTCCQRANVRRAHVAPLYPERFRQDGLLEGEAEIETHLAFFRAGAMAQLGFLLAALIGLAILFITPQQLREFHHLLESSHIFRSTP